jgi:dihydrofolate reductase
MISAIVAVNNDWGIGYNGDLLEHIPEDLKYFKALTTDHVVVMGQNTWDSLPKKPLPNRTNIVVTYEPHASEDACFWSMESVKLFMEQQKDLNFFVIGGGSIYKQLLPFCDRVYVTKIYKSHEQVDTYFPNLDELDSWVSAACGPIQTYKDLTYQFWQYDRI